MKKLFNSRFLFILASSIVVLILLIVGAFYLFDDEDDTFIKSGYVLNPLSSTSEKYFFNENVGYKENLSSMIEFKDVDDNKVSILKDSFIHYLDESLSFLKNGAILDLDSIKGASAVSFYNITNESILEKKDNGYVIESANGDIRLNNFIGRISENKYIVVGDLTLKMVGNDTTIKGEYFEIVYIEEGIVNIENKDVKYQVTADGTFINVGSDKVIDLGDKKITVNGEDLMSITSITIDGDENIEIIPKGNEDEEPGEDEPNNGEEQPGPGGNDEPGTGEDGTGNDPIEGEITEDIVVTLKDAEIGSSSISVIFDIFNATDSDSFKLQVVDLTSNKTVNMYHVTAGARIDVDFLTPNTKYLFTVSNERDNGKYFQKVFETESFGIKLEKKYATDSSLVYNVILEDTSAIDDARLTLREFNEENNAYDEGISIQLKDMFGEGNVKGELEIPFNNLKSDTIYSATLDGFSFESLNYSEMYNIGLTTMTLKTTPDFSEMTITKDVEGSFDLSLGNIDDPDNAIVSYTYEVYHYEDDSLAIEPIKYSNASPVKIEIGTEEGQLKNDTRYYFRTIIEYFDNEKYIEFVTPSSDLFMMGSDPYVRILENEEITSYNKIGFSVELIDNSCLVSMPGRPEGGNCAKDNTVTIKLYEVDSANGVSDKPVQTIKQPLFTYDEQTDRITYEGSFSNLKPGTMYTIEVTAVYENSEGISAEHKIQTMPGSVYMIKTKSLASFEIDWRDDGSSASHVVNAAMTFKAVEEEDTLSPEETLDAIERITVSLYSGDHSINTLPAISIRTLDLPISDVKSQLYNGAYYKITTEETFHIDITGLKLWGKGELSPTYTIYVEAYTKNGDKIVFTKNTNVENYDINPELYRELSEPEIDIDAISNANAGYVHENIDANTYVGYTVYASFNRTEYNNIGTPKLLNFYVYNNKKQKLDFYVKDENGELVQTDVVTLNIENCVPSETDTCGNFSADIYMDYGVPYHAPDDGMLHRGNYFYAGYEIVVNVGGKNQVFPTTSDSNAPSEFGLYTLIDSAKKNRPTLQKYISSSTADSITYYYKLLDADNAVYIEEDATDYGLYATVNGGEEIKLNITPIADAEYNQFEGYVTIDGLKKKDLYTLYYKLNENKSGIMRNDVAPYYDSVSSGVRTFDGEYNADNYGNFNYQIINDAENGNKVLIKILAEDEILNRILSYRIKFSDDRGNVYETNEYELKTCNELTDFTVRCIEISYTDLSNSKINMKSDKDKENIIRVDVTAIYDSGITGYDVKYGDDSDYPYMIMQDRSSELGQGKYITINIGGSTVEAWEPDYGYVPGVYTYSIGKLGITLRNQLNNQSYLMRNSQVLSDIGYTFGTYNLNPKMLSEDKMNCRENDDGSPCNTFSFSSITPRVRVSNVTDLINGSIKQLTISGADLNDFENEGTQSEPEYYIYVDVWDNINDVGNLDKVVRPTVKVKLGAKSGASYRVNATIDGLLDYNQYYDENNHRVTTGLYYFNVYAKLYKDNKVTYTQLFDNTGDGVLKHYDIKTLQASSMFNKLSTGISASDTIYGNRDLKVIFDMTPYNGVPYNFDITYVFCELADAAAGVCGPNEGEKHIYKKVIEGSSIDDYEKITDIEDITPYDLEYDKDYIVYAYANVDYYDGDTLTKRNVILNRTKATAPVRALIEPTFVVSNEATLIDDDYGIYFEIEPKDSDVTLVGNKYFVKLVDENGNVVGNMQILNGNGTVANEVTNYTEYGFDASKQTEYIRIMGLDPDTLYTFYVYNDVYINNYDEEVPKEDRIYEYSEDMPVYSTNTYGVAFGYPTYGITEKEISVSFEGGSNFDNVKHVYFTVSSVLGNQSFSDAKGDFAIGSSGKKFVLNTNSGYWELSIVTGLTHEQSRSYKIVLSFDVLDPKTGNIVNLTSADYPRFIGEPKFEK